MRIAAVAATVVIVSAGAAGCSSDSDAGPGATATSGPTSAPPPEATPMAADDLAALVGQTGDGSCEELDGTRCLLPFPSDDLTIESSDTDTGRRVDLPPGQLANTSGSTLDVTEWNRNDGFSPGTPMLISAPGVDLTASEVAPIGDIGRSMADDSPTALVDLDTGDRLAHWVEIDANALDGEGLLIVRPAASLPEGHHIGVFIGPLVGADGVALEAPLGFRAFRDRLVTGLDPIEDRRDTFETLFESLDVTGLDRAELYAAWDFTVASQRNLSERLLTMRDDAFDRIGAGAPSFTVSETITSGLPEGIGRRVVGTFDVPAYLTDEGAPGSRLTGSDSGALPTYAGFDYPAQFTCQIPAAALAGPGGTTRPVVYGHGLLGSRGEAENSQVAKIASTNDMLYCATDWIGMSEGDVGNAITILNDLSFFPSLVDRSQQGILNTVVLARVMRAADGFSSDPAFAASNGQSVIDTTEAYYDGNSQGGIMGGAATAISTEWTKAVLGVPGMNYALLLSRSVDFDTYFQVLRGAYPDPVDQEIIYGLLSMLWDRGEANGYAHHMTTDPYEGTPEHQVILDVGFGDHQVATVAAEVEARTIGAAVRGPALADGRHPDDRPFYGLDILTEFPTDRSVLVYWDSGTLPPPAENITPAESEEYVARCEPLSEDERERDAECADAHEDPRRAPASIEQKDGFFRPDGKVTDTCGGAPCVAEHRKNLDY